MPILPKELQFLKTALSMLNRIPPDELHELNESAFGIIDDVFRKRVAGLKTEEANELFERDARLFFYWNDAQPVKSSGAAFLEGALMMLCGEDFLREPPPPVAAPIATVEFIPPEGFREKKLAGGRHFVRKNCQLFIAPRDPQSMSLERQAAAMSAMTQLGMPGFIDEDVAIGPHVKGTRRIFRDEGRMASITYLLDLPNGHVRFDAITRRTSDLDLDELERSLSTLRILITE